jgi:hypothetical protein
MIKYIIPAFALGIAIVMAAPAYAGEDCLGLSIGPGCIGIDGDSGHHYRRVETRPAHPREYVAPNGGHYYYDDDTYYYEDHD